MIYVPPNQYITDSRFKKNSILRPVPQSPSPARLRRAKGYSCCPDCVQALVNRQEPISYLLRSWAPWVEKWCWKNRYHQKSLHQHQVLRMLRVSRCYHLMHGPHWFGGSYTWQEHLYAKGPVHCNWIQQDLVLWTLLHTREGVCHQLDPMSQRTINKLVKLKLYKGNVVVEGRSSSEAHSSSSGYAAMLIFVLGSLRQTWVVYGSVGRLWTYWYLWVHQIESTSLYFSMFLADSPVQMATGQHPQRSGWCNA